MLKMMKNNYEEITDYLFNAAPLFQNIGGAAYKEGLHNTLALDEHFGHPHLKFKTIHIAGTNGKGSCSHTIASILQDSGLKVGLFTSPHLIDFRERIRVNGEMISEQYVIDFVNENRNFFDSLHPSFFELTTAMAFKYFEEMAVDVAVIEVGLGGRLDCTNIIQPELSIITNISFDHVMFLGNTLEKIAGEKAGIIKENVPVVIGEYTDETRPVFLSVAERRNAPVIFAEDACEVLGYNFNEQGLIEYTTKNYGLVIGELSGMCQIKNANTILNAITSIKHSGFAISNDNVRNGFKFVCEKTGLMGRWQTLSSEPKVVCDTGHNIGGFEWIVKQLADQSKTYDTIRIVFGMVNDKDISGVLSLLPQNAKYYFCQASVKRALECHEIEKLAEEFGLKGNSYSSVAEAYDFALSECGKNDFVYVGGSTFVVADLLSFLNKKGR